MLGGGGKGPSRCLRKAESPKPADLGQAEACGRVTPARAVWAPPPCVQQNEGCSVVGGVVRVSAVFVARGHAL